LGRRRAKARWAAALIASAALALPVAAHGSGSSSAPVPALRATPTPVLGAKAFAGPYGEGWGTVRPATIFNGGDPSGSISDIRWRSWGGPTAIGWGRNPIFKPGGGYFAHPVAIELRAGALGHCGARRAYTHLAVRVPKRPGGSLGPWRPWSGAATICKPPY
jgi:hypothetical protein